MDQTGTTQTEAVQLRQFTEVTRSNDNRKVNKPKKSKNTIKLVIRLGNEILVSKCYHKKHSIKKISSSNRNNEQAKSKYKEDLKRIMASHIVNEICDRQQKLRSIAPELNRKDSLLVQVGFEVIELDDNSEVECICLD